MKPEIRQFDTPEKLLAFYHERLSDADFQKLVKLAEQLQRSSKANTNNLHGPKSATG
jgi:hypothetical protein